MPKPSPLRNTVPTALFSATPDSQLLFRMSGMTDEAADQFNALVDARGKRDWAGCVELVAREGIEPVFAGCKSAVMRNNLLYIRESMADVLAYLYRERLLASTHVADVSTLCRRMEQRNPLGWRMRGLYEKVVKDFLCAAIFGMSASRPWDGRERIGSSFAAALTGDGILCCPACDRERLRDFLFRNATVERVSCEKYRWGYVERDGSGRYVLPLNASVRLRVPATRTRPTARPATAPWTTLRDNALLIRVTSAYQRRARAEPAPRAGMPEIR